MDGVKVLDKVEHVIETGERDIADLIGEFAGLVRSLRESKANGHTKAAVHGGEFEQTVHVTTSVERKPTPPQEPATATDTTATPETPAE